MSPKLYKSSRTYDFFLKSFGFSRSLDRFLKTLTLQCPSDCRILDAGCGTGLLGLHFLERFPLATLQATDLEPNFLAAMLTNADKRGIKRQRISSAVADISHPGQLTSLDGVQTTLPAASFDLICTGAVVGYANDTEASIRQLIKLLSPGGYFVNVEMNEQRVGKFVSHRYHYHNISLARVQSLMCEEDCEVSVATLSFRHFPAKLTRTAIVGRKKLQTPGI